MYGGEAVIVIDMEFLGMRIPSPQLDGVGRGNRYDVA